MVVAKHKGPLFFFFSNKGKGTPCESASTIETSLSLREIMELFAYVNSICLKYCAG